ncbi:MAG: hypothetical protein ACKN9U_16095 [Pirellulaceae bacterium]
MGQFLFCYERPEPSTWAYMSTFLVVGIFFLFHRFWSLRNLDLLLIILLTPGLLMVYEGREQERSLPQPRSAHRVSGSNPAQWPTVRGERLTVSPLVQINQGDPKREDPEIETILADESSGSSEASGVKVLDSASPRLAQARTTQFYGFIWLLGVGGLWTIRMLVDTAMVRRPLLESNLTIGGQIFLGVCLFLFLMTNVLTSSAPNQRTGKQLGPGYILLNMLPDLPTTPTREDASSQEQMGQFKGDIQAAPLVIARVLALVANLMLIAGMVLVAQSHFSNIRTGVGAALLMLLLPYTAQMCGRVDHVLPGALLVMAIYHYRRPAMSGFFLGCAAGLVYYPFFLLPLWCSFYWQNGLKRFLTGLGISLLGLSIALVFFGGDSSLLSHLRQMYGVFLPAVEGLEGVWGLGWHPYFRLPLLVAFVLLSASFVFWPAQKNLGTLLCCSAAIMAAAQFWHGYGGGLYMAWYLPLVLLTIFRPNLEDRTAMTMVIPLGPFGKNKSPARRQDEDSLVIPPAA